MNTRNIHFDKKVKKLTVDLWLPGQSRSQIAAAVYAYRIQQRRL